MGAAMSDIDWHELIPAEVERYSIHQQCREVWRMPVELRRACYLAVAEDLERQGYALVGGNLTGKPENWSVDFRSRVIWVARVAMERAKALEQRDAAMSERLARWAENGHG
jgi:hypothetical protein